MAGSTLTYTLVGEDKSASKAMKGVGDAAQSSAKKTESSWKAAGAALSALAIVKFGSDSVKAFTEAQEATARLEDAFGKFPKLGDSSAASIEKITTALQKKTKFDDDATNAAAGLLAQFDLTGKQIENVLPLLQDYAAATGKDITDAASSLGKSFMGQTRALKEVGINYTSTGDRAQDFANITDLLSKKVGGFAENQGKTAAGQLAILKNQFGDVEEAIGGALVPALSEAGKVIIPLVEGVGKAVGWFTQLPGPIKLAAGALVALKLASKSDLLSGLAASFKNAVTSAAGFKSAMASVGKALAIGGGIALIGSLVDAMGAAGRKAEALRGEIDGVVQSLGDMDTSTIDFQKQFIEAARASTSYKTLAEAGVSAGDAMDYLTGKLSGQQIQQKYSNLGWQEQIKLVNGLGQGLDFNTGKIQKDIEFNQRDTAARLAAADAAKRLADANKGGAVTSGAYEAAHKSVTAAVLESGAAVDLFTTELQGKSLSAAWEAARATQALAAAHQDAQDKVSAARKAFEDAESAVTPAAAAAQKYADAESELARKTEEATAAIDKQNHRMPSNEEAFQALNDQVRDFNTAFGQGTEQVEHFGKSLIRANGTINTTTETGSKLYDQVTALAEAQHGAAQASFDQAGGLKNVDAATAAASATAKIGYDDFMAQATALGFTRDQAQDLATKYGLIPSTVSTTIAADASQANAAIDGVIAKAAALAATTATLAINAAVNVLPGHAAGGTIRGGIPGRDSVHAMLMPGEEVIRTSAANRGNNRAVLKAMNSGLLHFAGGGSVPSFNFAGSSSPSYGERQGNVVGSFGDLADWIKDLGEAARDTAADARDASHSLRVAQNEQRSEVAEVKRANAARLAAIAEDASALQRKTDADLKSAKTAKDRQAILKREAEGLEKLNAKQDKAEKQNAAALAKVTKAQNAKVAAAKREADATSKAARAADKRSDQESRAYQQTTRTRQLLSAAAQVRDRYNAKLETERDKMADLTSNRASLAGSVAGNISGIGGGILGFSDLRTNPASVLNGLQFNLKGQTAYTKNLAALKAKGLSSSLLSQIAQGGEDGQRVAASLAGASKQQIAQINRTQAAIDKNAATGGNLVGDSVFGRQIAAQQKVIDATAKTANVALGVVSNLAAGLTRGLQITIDAQGIARLNSKGVADLARRGVRI